MDPNNSFQHFPPVAEGKAHHLIACFSVDAATGFTLTVFFLCTIFSRCLAMRSTSWCLAMFPVDSSPSLLRFCSGEKLHRCGKKKSPCVCEALYTAFSPSCCLPLVCCCVAPVHAGSWSSLCVTTWPKSLRLTVVRRIRASRETDGVSNVTV